MYKLIDINRKFPEHNYDSCDDVHTGNAGVDGCQRCTAIALLRGDDAQKKLRSIQNQLTIIAADLAHKDGE